jgi:hypothetical protein
VTVKIDKDVHERLVQWQLSEQVRQGRKLTLSDTIDALLQKVPIEAF